MALSKTYLSILQSWVRSGLLIARSKASLIVPPRVPVEAPRLRSRPEARFRLRDGCERCAEMERDRVRVPGTIRARDNYRRHKQRDHLRKNQAANNHQSERTSRGCILSKAKREWHCAHQRGQRCHHDWTETLNAGFMNCRAKVPTLVDSLQSKIDHHDAVFLHDAEQKKKSDHAVERQGRSKNPKREQTADHGWNDRRKQDRDRMDITFVKNSKDHVHNENGGDQKQWQRLEKLSEHKRFALKRRLNAGILEMHLRERVFDKFGRIANRNVRQQIKINGNAGELIKMVYSLRTDNRICRCYGTQRNEIRARPGCGGNAVARRATLANRAAAVAAHVQIVEISRLRTLIVLHFEADLILVV